MRKMILTTAALAASLALAGTASANIANGETVADMVVTDSNGKTHNLSDFAGKRVVLEWTNHGCPYVKRHYDSNNMQETQKLATADGDTVWLSIISSAPGKQGYVSGEQANALTTSRDAAPTAVVLDPTGVAGKAFGATATPHMYIIDEAQTLVYQGAIDSNNRNVAEATNYVKAALADMDAGQPIANAQNAAYGCGIKYGS